MTDSRGRDGGMAPVLEITDAEVSIDDIKWFDVPALVTFWVLAIVVFLQFFTRYVLNDSLAWTEEVARYLLVLLAFLGSISASKRASHIMLEFLFRMVPARMAKILAVLSEAITLVTLASLTVVGIQLVTTTRQKMVVLPVPKAWIYAVCIGALAVMTVYSARWLWVKWRRTPAETVAALDHSLPID